jgi:hypothetical protein
MKKGGFEQRMGSLEGSHDVRHMMMHEFSALLRSFVC